ncbi:CS1 type fimbrial major subunit [Burkholderia vietnamiensis]|uniref:CS1 type fimbrial major subunit n=1 Tax=Burkholderia vietnamiensis TaxID=60552 RepID=UPI0012D97011|nr:CS1 type fimbrial major subunit [Burkholderia vietnamiensis]
MTSKKTMLTFVGVAAMAMMGAAHADTTSQSISIFANVPAAKSFVQPINGWGTYSNMSFGYDTFKKLLVPAKAIPLKLQNNLSTTLGGDKGTKKTGGSIKASLSQAAVLSDGTAADDIPVSVSIRSDSVKTPVVLSTKPAEIYTDSAGAEENGTLQITPDASHSPKAGASYQGTVDLVFDFDPA